MEEGKTTNGVRTSRLVVETADAGKRLDVLLAERIPELSRRRARVLISAGSVFVDGRRVLVHSRRLAAGQRVVCRDNPFVSPRLEALDPTRILHEDEALIAVDKPAGIPAHPTPARRQGSALQLAEELLRRREGRKVPLWPVHRLDTGTSGVLLFAKTQRAARAVSQCFARRRVHKRYLALVHGVPDPPEGEIRLALDEGISRTEASAAGKEAITRYRFVRRLDGETAVLEVEPLTGRMHQIRVHLAAVGHPVVGDPKYGPAPPSPGGLRLHAVRLELPHPEGGRPFTVESRPPPGWFANPD